MYSFEQRKKINDHYRENNIAFDNYCAVAFRDFYVYQLDLIDGIDTFHCTPIERNVFDQIRNRHVKFMPEYQIGKYFCDFVSMDTRTIIEADGKHHEKQYEYDQERDQFLRSKGFTVKRFKGKDTFLEYEDFLDENEKLDESRRSEYEQTSDYWIKEHSRVYAPSASGFPII